MAESEASSDTEMFGSELFSDAESIDSSQLGEVRLAREFTGQLHTCDSCSIQELDPSQQQRRAAPEDSTHGISIKYRGSTVATGASKGCLFFKDLLGSLQTSLANYRDGKGEVLSELRLVDWTYDLFYDEWTGQLETAYGSWTCADGKLAEKYREFGRDEFVVSALRGDPAAKNIRTRPFSYQYSRDGPESIRWARDHIENCERSHELCKNRASGFTPSYLLEIEKVDEEDQLSIRLKRLAGDMNKRWNEASTDVSIDYATLSYCWGGPQGFELCASSFSMLIEGVPVDKLPKTLQDAVQVAWNLGLHYIWIDCLCIPQDQPEEKSSEIARMHEIYANSFITISASSTSHCTESFLDRLTFPPHGLVSYKLPYASPSGSLGWVILSKGTVHPAIDARAWTFQEHLLSHRVLRFTAWQLHWCCLEGAEHHIVERRSMPSSHVENIAQAVEMFQAIRAQKNSCTAWMDIVGSYTHRELTHQEDILSAISGIAHVWSQSSDDQYVAGLWRSHLPQALLWSSAQPHRQGELCGYRGPSWSWASLIGDIDWFDWTFLAIDKKFTILACETDLAHSISKYGAVISGCLIVEGALCEVGYTYEYTCDKEEEGLYFDLEHADVRPDFCAGHLRDKIDGASVYALGIYSYDTNTGIGPAGLLLASSDEEQFFRIGMFVFEPPQETDIERLETCEAVIAESQIRRQVQAHVFDHHVFRKLRIM